MGEHMYFSQDKSRGPFARAFVNFCCAQVSLANALVGTVNATTPNAIIQRAVEMQIFPPLAEAHLAIGTSPSDLLRLVEHFTKERQQSNVSCISVNTLRESAAASWANYLILVKVSARGLFSIAYVDGAKLQHVHSDPQAMSNYVGTASNSHPNSHCVLVTRATVDVIEIINPDSGANGTWERMSLSSVAFIGCWRSLRGNGECTVATAIIGI